MTKFRIGAAALLVLVSCLACGQDIPVGWYAFRPNQEVRVQRLPSLMARSDDPSDLLLTSLDTVFHDRSICCGKDSALEDSALSADPLSLKEVASKLQGRHLLSDGRPILVTADFLSPSAGDAGERIISNLAQQHALLTVWNSHLYILYGVIFDEWLYSGGSRRDSVHKLLLLDARYSDSRREVAFNRETDDWSKVQGMLLLTAAPQ